MKILHVAYIYPPTFNVADGITNVVYYVTKELVKKGHKVTVFSSNMLDLHGNASCQNGHYSFDGVDVYYLKSILRAKTIIITPSLLRLLSNEINKFDILHIHDARSFQGISAATFSEIFNVPYIFQPHGSYLTPMKSIIDSSRSKNILKTSIDTLLSDRIVKNASKIIALTETEAQQYRKMGVPGNKIAVIPNGLTFNTKQAMPLRGNFKIKFGIDPQTKVLLYVGRVHKTKGIELLIKAFHIIKTGLIDNAQLVIAGPDDGFLTEAKILVNSLGISESVLFTGFLDMNDKMAALADADIFVTPSFSGFPVTFLEACSVGTPIITTSLGDDMPWLNNNVGLVTEPTIEAFAKAAYNILIHDDLRRQFSKNCVAIIQSHFSINKTVEQIEKIYAEAIENNKLV